MSLTDLEVIFTVTHLTPSLATSGLLRSLVSVYVAQLHCHCGNVTDELLNFLCHSIPRPVIWINVIYAAVLQSFLVPLADGYNHTHNHSFPHITCFFIPSVSSIPLWSFSSFLIPSFSFRRLLPISHTYTFFPSFFFPTLTFVVNLYSFLTFLSLFIPSSYTLLPLPSLAMQLPPRRKGE